MLQVTPVPTSGRRDLRLWGLNGGVLVMSFLLSGLANVIPQLILLQLAPDQKALWLPLCLIAGTTSAILGTLAGGAFWERTFSGRWILAPMLGTGLCFAGLLHAADPRVFAGLYAAACGLANLLVTRFDHLAARLASDTLRPFNDRLGTACRLTGMLIAPWFFTHQLNHAPAAVTALSLSLGLAVAALLVSVGDASTRALTNQAVPLLSSRLTPSDYLLLGHAVTVYASLYLFAANLSYFLRDALRLDQATPRSGILIVVVFVSALGVVGMAPLWARLGGGRRETGRASALALLPVIPLLGVLCAYESRAVITFQGMLAIAMALGLGYGCFLLGLRDYVSRSAKLGKGVMLTIYNNLANASALMAFLGMLTLAHLAPGSSAAYYENWMRLLGALAMTGVPLFLLARRTSVAAPLVHGDSRA